MKTIFICGLAKLRRKKVPSLLLGICIMLTAALFVNAFILLKELNTVFDRAYEGMEGPQMCCLWSRGMVNADSVRQYLEDSAEKMEYQITEQTKTIEYIEKDGVKLSNGILLELPETLGREMLSPKIMDEAGIEMPQKGEIWITPKIANILNLRVGDEVSLQLADQSVNVKVVRIVADPVFGSSNTNVYRMWCGYGRLSDFPLSENRLISYLEIRFEEYSRQAEQKFIRDTEAHFNVPLGDTLYTYDKIKSGYTSAWQMLGNLLCLVSVILAAVVIVLTLFLVKSDMDEDVRTAGIYQSLGMTGMQIIGIYLVSYGAAGFAGAGLGSLMGGWLNHGILNQILGNTGIYTDFTINTGACQAGVFAGVSAAVLLVCLCAVFRIRTLNASHAIRSGTWQTRERARKRQRNWSYNGRCSFELYYAVRGMLNKKAGYVYIASVSLILGCLSVVCFGCLNAVKNIDREPEAWGILKTDIYVTSLDGTPVSTVTEELEKEPEVEYTYGVNKIYSKYKPDHQDTWQSIVTELYELPWNEKIEDKSLYGRRPQKEGEISVGVTLARQYGLEAGEKMELYVNGEKKQFEITGIFRTLSNYGNVIRMVTDDLDQAVEADGGSGDYMLVLSKGCDKWNYARELTERYEGKFSFIASKSNGEHITGVLAPAVGTILAVLLITSVLITINLTFLLIRREQKLIGLLKAVGMTSWQILKIYLWRNCLAALLGSCLGLAAGTLLVPDLLTPFAKGMGLVKFPFSNSAAGMLVSSVLLPLCMALGTCAVVKAIHRVSVKQLVNE
ncbi:MAG: ABC transporter permease [Ruminococcus sp.]|uniref:FtsX-like permease family protein n=1 Tax=Schaedlerella arabinosiphila TaxID=2044587 RepID=A0A3R8KYZ1_9FIRM|nr:ABC transporter permease [Ruminococcus sp.]RRK32800.1 FtsX-like permease family protein [Schaedlerella arabinosiphila]